MGLMDFYHNLEDKYYDMVDALHLGNIADAIDRVVPSFIVFIAVILVLLGGLVYVVFQWIPLQPPTPVAFNVNFELKDPDGNPLAGIPATLTLASGEGVDKITNATGKFSIEVKPEESPLTVELNVPGFKPFSEQFDVNESQTFLISLQKLPQPPVTKSLTIKDSDGVVLGTESSVSIVVSFSCTDSSNAPEPIHSSIGEISVPQPAGCGKLFARIVVPGFEEETLELQASSTEATLSELPPVVLKGTLSVSVTSNTQSLIAGAQVKLYRVPDTGSALLANQGTTDAGGTFTFNDVEPGSYYVLVQKSGFKNEQSTTKQVNAGQDVSISIVLAPSSNEKKFFVKVVNPQQQPVAYAQAYFFLNKTLFHTTYTDTNGIAFINAGDTNASPAAVVGHASYVIKILETIPLLNKDETAPYVVQLEALAFDSSGGVSNAGIGEVKVSNEVGFPINGATAWLYWKDVNGLFVDKKSSNAQGDAPFNNLPAGTYQGRADSNALEGKSDLNQVVLGKKTVFPVKLSVGAGKVDVVVSEEGSALKIADANVAFYAFGATAPLSTVATNAQGKASASFDANKVVYAVVSKSGYYAFYTYAVQVIKGNVSTLFATLKKPGASDSLNVELLKVWNASQQSLASTMIPNSTYALEFRLTVPAGLEGQAFKTHTRTGKEANLDQAQDIVNIAKLFPGNGTPVYSGVFNPANAYSIPQPVSTDAKLANLDLSTLSAGQYQYVVHVFVKPGAVTNDKIEVRFQADGITGKTPTFLKTFTVGQPIEGQSDFAFVFFIKKLGDSVSSQVNDAGVTQLKKNDVFQVDFQATNFSDQNFSSSSNVSLQVTPLNASMLVDLASAPTASIPVSIPLGAFFDDQTVSGTFYLKPTASASLATVRVELQNVGTSPDKKKDLKFSIPADKELIVTYSPGFLLAGVPNTLLVGVTDSNNTPMIADVKVWVDSKANDPLIATQTSANGFVGIAVPALDPGKNVLLEVTVPDFVPFNATIPVSLGSGQDPSVKFDCVDVSKSTLNLIQGLASDTFKVTSNDCKETVEITIAGEGTTLSLDHSTTNPPMTCANQSPCFSLDANQSKDVKVEAPSSKPLGQLPVYVYAKFSSETTASLVKEIKAFVTNPVKCMSLDKTEYELSQGPSAGMIKNNCHVHVQDVSKPGFALAESGAFISNKVLPPGFNPNVPLTVDWSADTVRQAFLLSGDDKKWLRYHVNGVALGGTAFFHPSAFDSSYPDVEVSLIEDEVNLPLNGKGGGNEDDTWMYRTFMYANAETPLVIRIEGEHTVAFYFNGKKEGESQSNDVVKYNVTLRQGVNKIEVLVSDGSSTDAFLKVFTKIDKDDKPLSKFASIAPAVKPSPNTTHDTGQGTLVPGTSTPTEVGSLQSSAADALAGGFDEQSYHFYLKQFNASSSTLLKVESVLTDKVVGPNVDPQDGGNANVSVSGSGTGPSGISSNVHAFLFNGKAFAQYVGSEEDDQGNLNFSIASKGLSGSKYALFTVQDYALPSTTFPKIFDLVSVVDTSNSMAGELPEACTQHAQIKSLLAAKGFTVNGKVYVLGGIPSGLPGECASASVAGWNYSNSYAVQVDDNTESWGPGIIDVANKHAWTENSYRALMLFADNDPTGKNNDAPGTSYWQAYEEAAAQAAVDALAGKNVSAVVFMGIPVESGIASLIAESTYSANDTLQLFGFFAGQRNGWVESMRTDYVQGTPLNFIAELLLRKTLPIETQQFSVKLVSSEAELCEGANGLTGFSGAEFKPKVKLDWKWTSLESDLCDESKKDGAGSPAFVVCDAAQFSVELFNKLNQVKEAADAGNLSAAPTLLNFNAYLIKDGFSEDFKKDFVSYYASTFFETPSWFRGAPGGDTNFSHYFAIPDTLNFNTGGSTALPSSGLYNVQVDVNWLGAEGQFFAGGAPAASITVNLSKIGEISAVLEDNAFYRLPFDGPLGYDFNTSTLHRDGYGVSYFGATDVPVLLKGSQAVYTYGGNSANTVYALGVSHPKSFVETNINNRGVVLRVNLGSQTLSYLPSNATPVAVQLKAVNSKVDGAFYYLKEDAQVLSPVNGMLSAWNPIASSKEFFDAGCPECKLCADFSGNAFASKQFPDATAASAGSTSHCSLSGSDGQALGFAYSNIPNEEIFYETIFYTPISKSYELVGACSNPPSTPSQNNKQASFFAPHDKVAGGNMTFGVDYTASSSSIGSIQSIESLFNLIGSGYLCIGGDAQNANVFWNPKKLHTDLLNNGFTSDAFPLVNACMVP
ncbi:MAG: carboxypeptidase regulatory-like domain-containing protein [Candidatus Diapherotrites archaeon]|nr:carboxypeptidase regulatory-like domain-containing protein [Candidatus Diapherotrites archaeon]